MPDSLHPATTGADEPPADILVIGAGASGGMAARRLTEAGFRVVCLEQGRWPDRTAYAGATDEWELAGRRRWSADPATRQAPSDYPIDLTDSEVGVLNYNGVGGGTVLYAGQWARLFPSDFMRHSTEGVADDWPLTYDELRPYYERADRQFGVSGLGGDPAYPPGEDPPLPPLPIGEGPLRVARAHVRLGWHWWPAGNAILSAPYEGRHPCVQRGTCGLGCNEGAKGSTDLTHWPAVVAGGGRLVTGATVVSLPTDGRGRVTGAEWEDEEGNRHFQAADVILLAANGIGTPRLLLASASSRHPDGLANGSGMVGRRLMVHPLALVKGLFHDDLASWRGHAGGSIVSYQFYASDERRGFVGGAKWAMSPAGGPLRAALTGGGSWGAGHHRHVRERFGHAAHWGLVCEDLPDPDNRVDLSATLTDRVGLAAPRLTYRIDGNSHALCDWHVERARQSLAEAGAWHTELEMRYPANGHFVGTARMGDDPATSVVDRWCMAHEVPNLGIIDGSVFVTSGGVNPTATIAALALRAADHLVETRSARAVPTRSTTVAVGRPALRNGAAPADPPAGPPTGAERWVPAIGEPPRLAPESRARFARVAQLFIPAGDGMPSAGEVDVAGTLLDRALGAVPGLDADLAAVLTDELDHKDPQVWLATLRADRPKEHRTLAYAVAAAYYLDTEVRRLLHYPGQPSTPVRAEYPEYVAEGLLEPVLERWAATHAS